MDKQKAIDLLDNLIGMVEDSQENDYDTAIKMGIEALRAYIQTEDGRSGMNKYKIGDPDVVKLLKAIYKRGYEDGREKLDADVDIVISQVYLKLFGIEKII